MSNPILIGSNYLHFRACLQNMGAFYGKISVPDDPHGEEVECMKRAIIQKLAKHMLNILSEAESAKQKSFAQCGLDTMDELAEIGGNTLIRFFEEDQPNRDIHPVTIDALNIFVERSSRFVSDSLKSRDKASIKQYAAAEVEKILSETHSQPLHLAFNSTAIWVFEKLEFQAKKVSSEDTIYMLINAQAIPQLLDDLKNKVRQWMQGKGEDPDTKTGQEEAKRLFKEAMSAIAKKEGFDISLLDLIPDKPR